MESKKITLIVMAVVILLVGGTSAISFVKNLVIKKNSTLVTSTIVECDEAYAKTSSRRTNGKRRYTVKVYQHIVVEYDLNGQKVQRDMGDLQIGKSTSRRMITNTNSYVNQYRKQKGETMNLYVEKDGGVHLASAVDSGSSPVGLLVPVMMLVFATIVMLKK